MTVGQLPAISCPGVCPHIETRNPLLKLDASQQSQHSDPVLAKHKCKLASAVIHAAHCRAASHNALSSFCTSAPRDPSSDSALAPLLLSCLEECIETNHRTATGANAESQGGSGVNGWFGSHVCDCNI